jgi:hypothetical protein
MSIWSSVGRDVEALEPFDEHLALLGGAGAGFVGAIAMGIVFVVLDPELLSQFIPGLFGLEGSLLAGWIGHLMIGVLFGLAFAIVMDDPSLVQVSDVVWKSVVAGVVFGLVLAVVGMGVIMPMWSRAVGLSLSLEIPYVTVPLLAGHVVFGAVLGAVFPFVDRL